MLKPLMEKYDSFLLTERTDYNAEVKGVRTYFLRQVNRREKLFIPVMLMNALRTIFIYAKERPDVVVTTGVLAVLPMCLLSKLMRKKLVYIESFAKVNTPNESGKLLYKYADRFYVQWESMLKVYPKAVYLGGIY